MTRRDVRGSLCTYIHSNIIYHSYMGVNLLSIRGCWACVPVGSEVPVDEDCVTSERGPSRLGMVKRRQPHQADG